VKNDGAKFGFRSANGSFTGALKSLQQRSCDVAFVTFFIKDYETRSVQFSAPVYSDDVCLIVKKAGKIPQFILPLVTFDESLWIALVAFCLLGENHSNANFRSSLSK
jgi:ABC-type amino acid transport substrate-binding protein